MNPSALTTSAAPLPPRPQISGLEPLRYRLCLNRSLPLFSHLELRLNLPPPSGLLLLHKFTTTLYGYELEDVCLEHAQVRVI